MENSLTSSDDFSTSKRQFTGALRELFCISFMQVTYAVLNDFPFFFINLRSLTYLVLGISFFRVGLFCLKIQKSLEYLPYSELKTLLTCIRRNKNTPRMSGAKSGDKDEVLRRLESLPDAQRRFVEKFLVYCVCLTNPKTRQGMRLGIAAMCFIIVSHLDIWGSGLFLILGVICGLGALIRGGAGIVEDI